MINLRSINGNRFLLILYLLLLLHISLDNFPIKTTTLKRNDEKEASIERNQFIIVAI